MATRTAWSTAAVAAVGMLLAVSCGGGSTRRAIPTTSTPPTTVSVRTTGPYRWSQVSSPALAIGGGATAQLGAIAAPGSAPGEPWLIAGTVVGLDGQPRATVWSSRDGVAWTAQALGGGGAPSQAGGVAYWANRAVVVGSVGTGRARRAAVWISAAPGAPFAAVPAAPAFSDPDGAGMTVAAAGTLGLFAAGRAGTQQALWYSSDGTHWARQTQLERLLASEPGARISALLVAPQGVFAAGSARDGALQQAAMWTSTDASSWRDVRAPHSFTGPGGRQILGLATLSAPGSSGQGTELVAVGGVRSDGSWSPVSWVSPDGSSWSPPLPAFQQEARPQGNRGGAEAQAVATTGAQLVAVGGGAAQRVWTSTDGRSWAEVPLPGPAADARGWRTSLVASAGGTTVMADGAFGQPRVLTHTAAGWSEPSANPAVFGPAAPLARPAALAKIGGRLLLAVDVVTPGPALGQETTTVDFLTSPDGRAWQALPGSPVFSNAVVTSVAEGPQPGGVVAVGGRAPLSSAVAGVEPGAAAWASPDGSTWSAAQGGPAVFLGGSSPARAQAVTRTADGYVAVGLDTGAAAGTAAVAWTSADGTAWQLVGPLDRPSASAADAALGVCSRGGQVVAVGHGEQADVGEQARAWWSHDGARWTAATVTPPSASGAEEGMVGCIALPAGPGQTTWIAYGQSTDASGAASPALWLSSNGTQWSRTALPSVAGETGRVTGLAVQGPALLAVGGGAAPGLWSSSDGGRSWQRLDTSTAPWSSQPTEATSPLLAAFAGADPVVAGQVGGRLTVWSGTPTG